jgi:arylsulfatase A-like enzyme
MKAHRCIRGLCALSAAASLFVRGRVVAAAELPPKPNVVFILSDDVGYGDLSCYGAKRVHTPNLDRLAAGGLRLTDAHSVAATCTPSRYSIMTGLYAWRKPGTGILPGDAACLIPPGSTTLPSQFHKAGYTTAAIGKWHLGLGSGNVDWNQEIKPGPLELGFDTCFIIPATGDRVPTVFIRDHRVVDLDPADPLVTSYKIKVGSDPTGKEHPELNKWKLTQWKDHNGTIVNGISRIGFESGGHKARWKDDKIAMDLTDQARQFIDKNRDHPFFLYFATHDIHVPRVPNQQFVGTSQCGVRGDAIEELDWSVGQVEDELTRLNLADNTLVIFTSDNGPVVEDGYADGSAQALGDHKPAGPFSGGKYSILEGGTRMPTIISWPGTVKPGISDALLSQVDFLASMSALAGVAVRQGDAMDSVNVLPALFDQSPTARSWLVEESDGIALREGNWKLIPPHEGVDLIVKDEEGRKRVVKGSSQVQLFDLSTDPAETRNIASQHADIVAEMTQLLTQISRQKSPADRPPQAHSAN